MSAFTKQLGSLPLVEWIGKENGKKEYCLETKKLIADEIRCYNKVDQEGPVPISFIFTLGSIFSKSYRYTSPEGVIKFHNSSFCSSYPETLIR